MRNALKNLLYAAAALFAVNSALAQNPISNCTELQNIATALDAAYELTANIDCSETLNWESGAGFAPLGTIETPFRGTLNGKGFAISGLHINRPESDYVGLFGVVNGGTIKNLTLVNASVAGQAGVGALAGVADRAVLEELAVIDASVSGEHGAGALAGFSEDGFFTRIYVHGATVAAEEGAGGVLGEGDENTIRYAMVEDSSVRAEEMAAGGISGIDEEGSFTYVTVSNSSVASLYCSGGVLGLGELSFLSDARVANLMVAGEGGFGDEIAIYFCGAGGLVGGSLASSFRLSSVHDSTIAGGVSFAGGAIGMNIGLFGLALAPSGELRNIEVEGTAVAGGLLAGGIAGAMVASNQYDVSFVDGTVQAGLLAGGVAGVAAVGATSKALVRGSVSCIMDEELLALLEGMELFPEGFGLNICGGAFGAAEQVYLDNIASYARVYGNTGGGLVGLLGSGSQLWDSFAAGSVTVLDAEQEAYGAGLLGYAGESFALLLNKVVPGAFEKISVMPTWDSIVYNTYAALPVSAAGSGGFSQLTEYLKLENSFSASKLTDGVGLTVRKGDMVDLTNYYFDAELAGTTACVGGEDGSAEGCHPVNAAGADRAYFINNAANLPMSKWDFEEDWKTCPGGYPVLRWLPCGLGMSAVVSSSSLLTATPTEIGIQFTVADFLPPDGRVRISFPAAFTLNSGEATAVTAVTNLDGTYTTATDGQVMVLTRTGGSEIPAGTALSLTLNNVLTPAAAGSGGLFDLHILNGANAILEEANGIPGPVFAAPTPTPTPTPEKPALKVRSTTASGEVELTCDSEGAEGQALLFLFRVARMNGKIVERVKYFMQKGRKLKWVADKNAAYKIRCQAIVKGSDVRSKWSAAKRITIE